MKLVTAAGMRALDREAIERHGVPSLDLMEQAGAGIAEFLLENIISEPGKSRVAVFCGTGNNGGDGFVIARYLHTAECATTVYFMGPITKLSADARVNFDRAAGAGVELIEIKDIGALPELLECGFIIDALLGTGSGTAPHGLAAELIEYINYQAALVVAVDLPSGLNVDAGTSEGAVVSAGLTLTLGLPKYGLFVSPGREQAGHVEVIPIGLPPEVIFNAPGHDFLTQDWLAADLLPLRKPDGHKGDFGKLLAVSGSTGLTGASALTGLAAARSGCGTVKIACPQGVQPVLATKLTEVMTIPLPDIRRKGALALRALGEIRQLAKLHDALVIGPGLGLHHETLELVRRLVTSLDLPMLLDADALKAFAKQANVLKEMTSSVPPVLTPHGGEFTALFEKEIPPDIQDRCALIRQIAQEYRIVLVLKGSPTLIGTPDGNCFLNPSGNDGMATGGSGDVLSGIIGSLLAQGADPADAAQLGVFVHGVAGDMAAAALSSRAMIAGDIIAHLAAAFRLLESKAE